MSAGAGALTGGAEALKTMHDLQSDSRAAGSHKRHQRQGVHHSRPRFRGAP